MTRITRLALIVTLAAAPFVFGDRAMAGYATCASSTSATCTCYTSQHPNGYSCTQAQANLINARNDPPPKKDDKDHH